MNVKSFLMIFIVAGCTECVVHARDLVWTGAEGSAWDLSTRNWRVAGDETKEPVAFQNGDNALFDDSATNKNVCLTKFNAANFQFNIGNVVFSNEVFTYSLDSSGNGHCWIGVYGEFGSIEKWGEADLIIKTRLDTPGDYIVHNGRIKGQFGSNWIGEFRSVVGSLHDTRTVSFLTNSVFDFSSANILGAPTSADRVKLLFDHATLEINNPYGQNICPVEFKDSSILLKCSPNLFFSGDVAFRKGTLAIPYVLGRGTVTFGGSRRYRTVTVEDVTGDEEDDLIITNKLTDFIWTSNTSVFLMNNFRKNGSGTMTLGNSGSTTTGDFEVVEGTLKLIKGEQDGKWTPPFSPCAIGAGYSERERTITIWTNAVCLCQDSDAMGNLNDPRNWHLLVDGGTFRLADEKHASFGTLTFRNATFDYNSAAPIGWFPYGFLSIAKKFALSGNTPYDFQPHGKNRAQCFLTIGFTLDSKRDNHPIPEAEKDPEKYDKFTNMWNVIDLDVADITKDSKTDVTIGWIVRDMPNMSYQTINALLTWDGNIWRNFRFHGGIRKTGAGTLRLNGANTYTYTTEVAEGSLLVDSTIAKSSNVTVNAGAFLGGTGTVATVTIQDGGGLVTTFARDQTNILRVASLAANSAVRVRVLNPEEKPYTEFNQQILRILNKPHSVDFTGWNVEIEGVPSSPSFVFRYDELTGIVSACYSGGSVILLR